MIVFQMEDEIHLIVQVVQIYVDTLVFQPQRRALHPLRHLEEQIN